MYTPSDPINVHGYSLALLAFTEEILHTSKLVGSIFLQDCVKEIPRAIAAIGCVGLQDRDNFSKS